jgi:ATP-dependent helicase/nuclease subunit B
MRALRREYDVARAREGKQLWDSPDILSYTGWLRRLWQECVYVRPDGDIPYLLDPAQEHALWEDAIRKSGVSGPLLDIPETARAAASARDLLIDWRISPEAVPFGGLEDTEAFCEWLMDVNRRFAENGWITASQLPAALERYPPSGAGTVVTLAGFDDHTPASRSLFEALRRSGYSINERPEPSASGKITVSRAAYHATAEEIRAAAVWARTKLESSREMRIGVIVRGLAGVSTMVERIFDEVLHPATSFRTMYRRAFQLANGQRASDAPILATALGLLKLVQGMPLAEAVTLLRSPFMGPDWIASARLEGELRRFGCESVSVRVDRVARFFPNMAAAAQELSGRKRPSQWSSVFSQLLTSAGWPGPRGLSTEERDALDSWDSSLSTLARLDVVVPRMTFDAALTRLRGITNSLKLTLTEDDAPVEIMDFADAEGAQFDALWIAGLHAAVWPQPARPNPFLPAPLQRDAEMPHSSAEWELARSKRTMKRLLTASKEVVCSYPRTSGEELLRPSPLIEAFPQAQAGPAFSGTALDRTFLATAPMEQVPLGRAPELPAGSLAPGGTSLIADQAACPFRAFAKHRLQARETDESPLGISPSEHGSVAHAALEIFWREVQSHEELHARSSEEIRDAIHRAVRAALDTKLSRRERNPAFARFRSFEESRLARLIEEWIAIEKQRRPFEVVQNETGETVQLGGLQIKVRVDRIDRYEDGTHAILDYKTGAISRDGWDGDRPDAPQLPVYAVTERLREISEIAYAHIAPEKVELINCDGEVLAHSIPEWREVLTALAEDFRTGDAEVDPKDPPKTCQWCALKLLCRVNEKLGTSLDTAADGEENA